MSDVDPLVAFVLARIAEDEAAARLSCSQVHPTMDVYHPDDHEDPKMLARCAALRALVAPHVPVPLVTSSRWVECARCIDVREEREDWPCDVVRGVAAIWSWHPEYQAGWAVDA